MDLSFTEHITTGSALLLISGVCWSIVYITLIKYGFKYKTYGMPIVAMALNITWEGLYGFTDLMSPPHAQHIVNIIWFCLDLIMVYQYFKFGRKYFSKKLSSKLYIPWSIAIFLIALSVHLAFLFNFKYSAGSAYSSFLINLVMSFLFINQLLVRDSPKEMSMTVAIMKCIGTLAATIGVTFFGTCAGNTLSGACGFILIIGLLCFLLDLAYILLLNQQKKIAQKLSAP